MKVAINGLGRIGRQVLKRGIEKGINFVAINDLADSKTLAYLLKYDSVYGIYKKNISFGENFIKIGNKKILLISEKNPNNLPWKKLGVDYVIESTGFFTDRLDAQKHLKAGAKKVIISAPSKNPDITVVLGVNDKDLKKSDKIISMASCTTNCLAPIVKVLNDNFGIKKGFMTTIHAYTSNQNIQDSPSGKLRRGRAGAENIVPTTSGATSATIQVIPELKGKINGLAMRVPVICGSIVDFVAELNNEISLDKINNSFKEFSNKSGEILEYSNEELVSRDIIGNSHSSIIDGLSTQIIGNSVKILSFYDNEYGYSCRIVDLLKILK
jgi:glyceraldehyde 3-phosphate dehydrogenase